MKQRTKMVVAVAGVVVVLIAGFMLLIRPQKNRLAAVRDDVAAAQDQTQSLQAELARLEQLQKNAPQLQADLETIRGFVPRDDEVPNFIFQVQDAANRSGVGFLQITPELPKQPPEGAALAEVRAVVRAQGGFFSVQDFARRLYDLDRALRMDIVTLKAVDDDEEARDKGRVEMEATVRIFFELPAGATTTTVPTTGDTSGSTAGATG